MGEQIANNREEQMTALIVTNERNERVVIVKKKGVGLIMNDYLPIGETLVFPKKWGRKTGALTLLDNLIADQVKIIEQAHRYITELEGLRKEVDGWNIDK